MFIQDNKVIRIPFFNEEECKNCIEYAEWKEKQFKTSQENIPDICIVDDNQVNTRNYNSYNFFIDNYQYINRLSDILQFNFPNLARPLLVQAWTNIYRKGEGISWHTHIGTNGQSYTANIFLGGNTSPGLKLMKPGDDNIIWHEENNIGEMLLMHIDTNHSVDKNESDETRYSIGMTIHSYHGITPDNLSDAAANTSGAAILIA